MLSYDLILEVNYNYIYIVDIEFFLNKRVKRYIYSFKIKKKLKII